MVNRGPAQICHMYFFRLIGRPTGKKSDFDDATEDIFQKIGDFIVKEALSHALSVPTAQMENDPSLMTSLIKCIVLLFTSGRADRKILAQRLASEKLLSLLPTVLCLSTVW